MIKNHFDFEVDFDFAVEVLVVFFFFDLDGICSKYRVERPGISSEIDCSKPCIGVSSAVN